MLREVPAALRGVAWRLLGLQSVQPALIVPQLIQFGLRVRLHLFSSRGFPHLNPLTLGTLDLWYLK